MNTLFDIQPLLQALDQQALILTPNRRLAAKILESHSQYQRQHDKRCWPSPRVFSLEAWVSRCWEELQDLSPSQELGIILDNRQELLLWEQVIAQHQESSPLLKPAGAAQQAQSAYRTLGLWRQSCHSGDYLQHRQPTDLFPRWVEDFEQRCRERGWLTQTMQMERLIDACADLGADHPQGLDILLEAEAILVSFQDISPLHQALIDRLCQETRQFQPDSRNRQQARIGCADPQAEIELSAQWARQVLQRSPGANIGILVPQLQNLRADVERHYRRQFDRLHFHPGDIAAEPPFNISAGTTLADAPVIHQALRLLSYRRQPIELDQLPDLLYSPFLALEPETLDARVSLEYRLRGLGKAQFSLHELGRQVDRLSPTADEPQGDATGLQRILVTLRDSRAPYKAPPGDWANWSHRLLSELGWPGTRTPSSLEYQQLTQWNELLEGLGRLDQLLGPIPFAEALALLRKEAQASVFQPRTNESPIQILGPLEAAGLQFSHLWVMGLSDDCWPPSPSPNPLLPLALQRQLQMPHATPERELAFARRLTQSYLEGAETVIFSHPQYNDDQPLRPSALIAPFAACSSAELPLGDRHRFQPDRVRSWLSHQQMHRFELERIDTGRAPAVDEAERTELKGGSQLVKNQALCPFSGFAIHRLLARPLEQPALGLGPADRGNALHQALEIIWNKLASKQNLINLSEKQLEDLMKTASAAALAGLRAQAQPWMGERFWQIEHRRLRDLLRQWLALEAERPEFYVLATEQSLQMQLAGLPLKLRIDRIDQLADGSLMLVDYKSGNCQIRDWVGERPPEPQLPLYLIATRKPVGALAFARVNVKEPGFKGICEQQSPAEGVVPLARSRQPLPEQWAELKTHWEQTLSRLVEAFLDGDCRVQPLNAQAYRYNGLEPLNRIYEFDLYAQQEPRDER